MFAKAREKARQTSCLSNLKQLAIAELSYEQDYDEMTGDYNTWCEKFYPYVKNDKIFKCPSSQVSATSPYATYQSNYGINITYVTPIGATGTQYLYSFRRVAGFPYPSETMLATDSSDQWRTVRYNYPTAVSSLGSPHNEGANIAYFDGHAKWDSRSNIISPQLQPTLWRGGM